MASVDKIIEDLIKGASRAGAQVELQGALGREEKLAWDPTNLIGLVAAGVLPGAALGALSGGEGHRLEGAGLGALGGLGGAAVGGLGGAAAGLGLGGLGQGNPQTKRWGQMLTGMLGGAVGIPLGSAAGGALAGRLARPSEEENPAMLEQAAHEGAKAACDRFGLKHAFLGAVAPLAGSLLGPMAARAGLARVAPAMAKGLGQGFKGQAFDMAASMGGQMLGSKLTGGPQQG